MTTIIRRRPYPSGEPSDEWSLGQGRRWLRTHRIEGVPCPCCTRMNKVYARRINHDMASSLITFYRQAGRSWGHRPSLVDSQSGDDRKLRFWGILEEEGTRRADGGRAGWWRVTEHGERFVLGEIRVREFALLYNNQCEGFAGGWVSIRDCLGVAFNYAELMRGIV